MVKRSNYVKQAVILAAGPGTRLLDQTRDLPKALIEVNGRPILDYQLEALYDNGIHEVYVVVGHHGEKIRQHIHQFWSGRLNVSIIENPLYRSYDSAYSFWLASHYLAAAPHLHVSCDLIFAPELIARLLTGRQHNIIVMDRKARLSDNVEQVVVDGNRIVKMQNATLKGAAGRAVGLAKLGPRAVSWLRARIRKAIDNYESQQSFFALLSEAVTAMDFYVLDAGDDLLLEINNKFDLKTAATVLTQKTFPADFHFNAQYFRAAINI